MSGALPWVWDVGQVLLGLRRAAGRFGAAGAPLFSREGGSPDWVPAFAGEQGFGGAVATDYFGFTNWAPAFAGVVLIVFRCFLRGPTRSSG